jgi:hypothetical protein
MGTRVLSQGLSDRSVIIDIDLLLASRLRMSGIMPLLALYTLMSWTGAVLTYIQSEEEVLTAFIQSEEEVNCVNINFTSRN